MLRGGWQHAKEDEVPHLLLALLAKAASTIFTNRTSLVPPIVMPMKMHT